MGGGEEGLQGQPLTERTCTEHIQRDGHCVADTERQHSIRHGLKRAVRWENRPIGIRLHSEQSYCPDPWRPAPSSGGGVKLNLVLPI